MFEAQQVFFKIDSELLTSSAFIYFLQLYAIMNFLAVNKELQCG